MLKKILIFVTSITFGTVAAQHSNRSVKLTFDESNDSAIVAMTGLLDASNTFTYPNSIAFQHMKRVSISNKGNSTVKNPRLIINNKRNWFDINSIREECFAGISTPKDKALAVWKFMRDNRLHYFEPDYGREIDDPVKLLGVYGYGMCYNTSFATASLASGFDYTGQIYMEYSPRNRHSVKDIKFDSTFFLLDSDVEVFYLRSDNNNLASYEEIANDHYLIKRTHHYGKGYHYNSLNSFLSDAIYAPTPPLRYAGLYPSYHTLDFTLRPGEKIEYSWDPAKYYHHYVSWATHNAPPEAIGNGRFIFTPDFVKGSIDDLLYKHANISVSQGEDEEVSIHPKNVDDSAYFVIKITSPFVIVNSAITGSFFRDTPSDYLAISFSKDSINWESVWQSSGIGEGSDSINLYSHIKPVGSPAVYEYFIKVDLLSTSSPSSCGIKSLNITSDFQVSRFFLPALELGNNTVAYSDMNVSRDVEVEIHWRETSENDPPSQVQQPIFPADQSSIDSLKFMFKWPAATDEDGIIDYEFILSDRPDLRFPLSPSFEIYTSMTDDGGPSATFTIPFDGMLNSNTTYYWRIRAKDSKGAWGEWSPTWSFTPRGPMPPEMFDPDVRDTTISLNWSDNREGFQPLYYEIHGSNRAFGFMPQQSTLLDTTKAMSKNIVIGSPHHKIFYRVVAVDQFGNKSGPSNYTMLEYPKVYSNPDSVRANTPFSFKIDPKAVYTTDMFLYAASSYSVRIADSIQINVLHKPSWLFFDEQERTFYGEADYSQRYSDSLVIEFTSIPSGYSYVQTINLPAEINSAPVLTDIDSLAFVNHPFEQTVYVVDPDFSAGDYVSQVEIIEKPSWLTLDIDYDNARIHLGGTPYFEVYTDSLLTLKVYDSQRSYSVKTFQIHVTYKELAGTDLFTVAPNPFDDIVHIYYELEEQSDVNVKIFSATSQLLFSTSKTGQSSGVHKITWNSGHFPSGIYFVVVEVINLSETKTKASRIIKR